MCMRVRMDLEVHVDVDVSLLVHKRLDDSSVTLIDVLFNDKPE
jgi:hypothetical protein